VRDLRNLDMTHKRRFSPAGDQQAQRS